MRKVYKILIVVFSLIGVAYSICMVSAFIFVPYISDMFVMALDYNPWLNNVFAALGAVAGLVFLSFIPINLFSPNRSDFLIIEKGSGKLLISGKTIQSTIKQSITDINGVNNVNIKARLGKNPEKTKILIRLAVSDSNGLIDVTEAIRARVEAALLSSLGIVIKSITIQINEPLNASKDSKYIESKIEAAAARGMEPDGFGMDSIESEPVIEDKTKEEYDEKYDESLWDTIPAERWDPGIDDKTLSGTGADAIIGAYASVRAGKELISDGIFDDEEIPISLKTDEKEPIKTFEPSIDMAKSLGDDIGVSIGFSFDDGADKESSDRLSPDMKGCV